MYEPRPCSYGNVIVSGEDLISFCGRMEEEEKKNMTLCAASSFDNFAILMGCTFFVIILFLWKMLHSFKDLILAESFT